MTHEKRKTVIKWLQNEIRSLRLAPTINGCGPENWADLLEIMETCLEAVRGHGSEPLALEQLRGMRGKWVWIESPDRNLTVSGWAYVGKDYVFTYWEYEEDKLVGRIVYNICDYGAWLAYAYQPAHIDREAWEPCEYCNGAKYVYGQASAVVPNGDKGQIEKEVEGDFDYCPECGRPLTPEAWDMLEKRLRG